MTAQLQTPTRTAPRNGLGIAALVLGILALISSVSLAGLMFGSITLALGLAARDAVLNDEATNRNTTIAALVLGVVAIVISLATLAVRIWLIV